MLYVRKHTQTDGQPENIISGAIHWTERGILFALCSVMCTLCGRGRLSVNLCRCDAAQLSALHRANLLPASATSCGLVTLSDAARIVSCLQSEFHGDVIDSAGKSKAWSPSDFDDDVTDGDRKWPQCAVERPAEFFDDVADSSVKWARSPSNFDDVTFQDRKLSQCFADVCGRVSEFRSYVTNSDRKRTSSAFDDVTDQNRKWPAADDCERPSEFRCEVVDSDRKWAWRPPADLDDVAERDRKRFSAAADRRDRLPVCHACFGGCSGVLSRRAGGGGGGVTIRCDRCATTMSPELFVSHSHRLDAESRGTVHWGFRPALPPGASGLPPARRTPSHAARFTGASGRRTGDTTSTSARRRRRRRKSSADYRPRSTTSSDSATTHFPSNRCPATTHG